MKIYLIGMPGSGKTSVGRKLAEKLNLDFIDLDHLIEKEALMFTDELFIKYGEETFRKLETKALESIQNRENIIVSCGGGIVTVKENKNYMNGLVFYIDTRIETIKKRIKNEAHRPLLQTKTLEQLYDERFLKYQSFANYIVSNDKDEMYCIKQIEKILLKDKNK